MILNFYLQTGGYLGQELIEVVLLVSIGLRLVNKLSYLLLNVIVQMNVLHGGICHIEFLLLFIIVALHYRNQPCHITEDEGV